MGTRMPPMKHIVDTTVTDEAGAVIRQLPIAIGTVNPDPYNALNYQVKAGSIIATINMEVEIWINNKTTASTIISDRLDWFIWFNVAGAQSPPDPRTAGTADTKNQILHIQQAVLGCSTVAVTSALNVTQRVTYAFPIHLPKWARQLMKDDRIELVYVFSDSAATHNLKMKNVYLEFYP